MKRPLPFLLLFGVLFFTSILTAQKAPSLAEVQDFLTNNGEKSGLVTADYSEIYLTDAYADADGKTRHAYVQQYHNGIAVSGAIAGLHTDANGTPFHFTSRFVPKLTTKVATLNPAIDQLEAIRLAAAQLLEGGPVGTLKQIGSETGKDRAITVEAAGLASGSIPVHLVYVENKQGFLRLSWELELYTTDQQHYYVARVDAVNGDLLSVQDLVISCTFDHAASPSGDCDHAHTTHRSSSAGKDFASSNAFATSNGNYYRVYDLPVATPNHGNRSLVVTNGDPIASPFGWHNDGTLSYPVTRGNNVYAYYDGSGGNAGEPAVGGLNPLQPLNFDFELDLTQQPVTYKDAAITNLFYWNNKIHDVFYHFGFDEAAGNFQQDNLNRGGLGLDGVMAEAQDGGGTNNANFLTLPDGAPGRMQMYLWGSAEAEELVHINSSASFPNGGPSFISVQAAFGEAVTQQGIDGDLILVEANDASISECSSCGCGTGQGVGLPPNNTVTGKIVLIDRGDCSFIEKVMGAQVGGASGVIVANNIPGQDPISMGGDETGNLITIPAVMISFEAGAQLKQELEAGAVNVALRRDNPISLLVDGDLDNGIITHEYGHGISTRLTGGPSQTCLGGDEQAGEGWSDFFALMLTTDLTAQADGGFSGRGIGTYVLNQGNDGTGIRPARYSRDFTVNPYTYADLNNSEISVPHGIGFIFCTVLHDMAWNLIDEYGYNPDLVNGTIADGNILALQLVIDGLKLQPCSPTFLESRDAILAADQALTGGANACLIWDAFAKRGMGASAVSGTNSRGDEIAAFDIPESCTPVVSIEKTVDSKVVENGQELTYTLTVTNGGDVRARSIRVVDPLDAGLSYVSGSASPNGSFHSNTNSVKFSPFHLDAGAQRVLTFRATVNSSSTTDLTFFDDMEDGINAWSPSIGVNQWQHTAGSGSDGSFAWYASDPDNASNQILELSNPVTVPTNGELRFTHRFSAEAGFDGGVVELSNDGGLTWYDLGNQMTAGGYTSFIPLANNPLINGFAFAGSSNGWTNTSVNLSLFAGQTVTIRFRFASDVLTGGDGWYIDDVIIGSNITDVNNTASLTAAGAVEAHSNTVSSLVVAGNSLLRQQQQLQAAALNTETGEALSAMAYPNPATGSTELVLNGLSAGEVNVETIDLTGRTLSSISTEVTDGSLLRQQLDLSQLISGVYLVRITNAQRIQTLRLTVE